MAIQLYRGAGVPEEVKVNTLVSLQDAGFQDAEECFRGIDDEHVQQLALSDPAEWPPLEVVSIGPGVQRYAVIDGYHRWNAAQAMKAESIIVRAGNYESEAEVIESAFRANLKNGRAATTEVRSKYALWLFWKDPSDNPNLSAIARKVGLNQSTVYRAVQKELKQLDAEEAAEKRGMSVQEITETERLLKAIRRYMEQETAFFAGEHGERSVKKRASSLLNHLNTIEDKNKQRRAIQDVQTLALTFGQIEWTDGQKRKKA